MAAYYLRQRALMEIAACVVLAIVAFVIWRWSHTTERNVPYPRPFVAVLPHQDDELFMAGFIVRAVASGRPVYVALVTDGGASSVRFMINGTDMQQRPAYDWFQGTYHHPAQEGYAPLGRPEFSTARNREFFDSVVALGVREDHILFMNPGGIDGSLTPVYRDGALTKEEALRVFSLLFQQFGDGTYATVAKGHHDHVALEAGLEQTKGITEKLFFPLSPADATDHITLSLGEREEKKRAIDRYSVWDPAYRQYAIARHSVPDLFRLWEEQEEEYYFTR